MKLGLGTAQFGMPYGVTNYKGQCEFSEIVRILQEAKKHRIALLDTAALYGDSEKILGTALDETDDFCIVTKTPTFPAHKKITRDQADHLRNTFLNSLNQLNRSKCYGLLVHHASDLLKENSEYLMDALLELKKSGQVARIGVSIYTGQQIDEILERYPDMDIIQLPLNVFDQRLIVSGHLDRLKTLEIEVHVRSVFLQGLLLSNLPELPSFFDPVKPHFDHYFKTITAMNLSRLQAALLFVKQINSVDKILVGVTSVDQLLEIILSYRSILTYNSEVNFSFAGIQEERFINPALWRL